MHVDVVLDVSFECLMPTSFHVTSDVSGCSVNETHKFYKEDEMRVVGVGAFY